MTAQGSPRAIFGRAIQNGNLLVAESLLREVRPTLSELLDVTALTAFKAPHRFPRVSARWRPRLLEQKHDATIHDVALATACLTALGGKNHGTALATLRDMAEEASFFKSRRGVA